MSQEPAAESITISGFLTSTAENPVISRIRIAVGNEIWEGVTNAAGYYEFETDRLGRNIAIYPHDDLWDVRAHPDTSFHSYVLDDVRQDFTISPGVVVNVNYGRVHYDFGGTQVWVEASKVAEFDDLPYAIFYPDDYWLGHNGTLWFGRPFTRYSPQDTEGVPDIYDCRYVAIDKGGVPNRHYQTPQEDRDAPAAYSWDNPGGVGWDRFTATPNDHLPNNPNIYVRADFNLVDSWSRDDIRLNLGDIQVHPSADLTAQNGYIAEFSTPIVNCFRDNYQIEIRFMKAGYSVWWPLNEFVASGTSDADLNGDGYLNLPDVGIITLAAGTCEGDSGFLPCADYIPDGCITFLQDGAAWTQIQLYEPVKALESGPGDAVAEIFAATPGAGVFGISVDAKAEWGLALVQFSISGDASAVRYAAPAGCADRALMVSDCRGGATHFAILAAMAGRTGSTDLGTISGLDDRDPSELVVSSVSVQSVLPTADGAKARGDGVGVRSQILRSSPNPFNPTTTIAFTVTEDCAVSLKIYDVAGRLVRTLADGAFMDAGGHELAWAGNDDAGRRAGAGVYLCRLQAGADVDHLRLTLLK